ncbi:MAG: M20 family metallopeptidase [Chloroflexi bacterium]|nr:M20 family metallopeptidase [Chloroflexota bacterium]
MQINYDYLLETLKKSIQINSVIPKEEELAAFFAEQIRKLGLELACRPPSTL